MVLTPLSNPPPVPAFLLGVEVVLESNPFALVEAVVLAPPKLVPVVVVVVVCLPNSSNNKSFCFSQLDLELESN